MLEYEPKLEAIGSLQAVRLLKDQRPAGRATWHLTSSAEGVVQLLELHIEPPHRRRGLGGQLLEGVVQQIQSLFRQRSWPLRRLWVVLEQQGQMPARAFLLRHGFHQTGTAPNLYRRQDALIYTRCFD